MFYTQILGREVCLALAGPCAAHFMDGEQDILVDVPTRPTCSGGKIVPTKEDIGALIK